MNYTGKTPKRSYIIVPTDDGVPTRRNAFVQYLNIQLCKRGETNRVLDFFRAYNYQVGVDGKYSENIDDQLWGVVFDPNAYRVY